MTRERKGREVQTSRRVSSDVAGPRPPLSSIHLMCVERQEKMVEKEQAVISEEEAAQYDRQIRLWGLEAQNR